MDQLLVVPLRTGVQENFLEALRQSGWRLTVTTDIVRAKQLLQNGGVDGLMIEFSPVEHEPERYKVLRYVHEFCPGTMVIMLHANAGAQSAVVSGVVKTLDAKIQTTVDQGRTGSKHHGLLDLYNLTPAQKRIAELVAQAYPNREIARQIKIKEQSVRNEISRIFKKIGVWNRVELALLMRDSRNPAAPPTTGETAAARQPWPQTFDATGKESPAGTRAAM